jgi:hypothetical protein
VARTPQRSAFLPPLVPQRRPVSSPLRTSSRRLWTAVRITALSAHGVRLPANLPTRPPTRPGGATANSCKFMRSLMSGWRSTCCSSGLQRCERVPAAA